MGVIEPMFPKPKPEPKPKPISHFREWINKFDNEHLSFSMPLNGSFGRALAFCTHHPTPALDGIYYLQLCEL